SLLATGLLVAAAAPVAAHGPYRPYTICSMHLVHDWVLAGSSSTGVDAADGNMPLVVDGALDCPPRPACVPDVPAVGDACTPALLQNGDGDPEWGLGGAFLPALHHRACHANVLLERNDEDALVEASAGVDLDGDGVVSGASPDDILTAAQALGATTVSFHVIDADDGRACADLAWTPDVWVFVRATPRDGAIPDVPVVPDPEAMVESAPIVEGVALPTAGEDRPLSIAGHAW
ncbi:MAG TPA: hypothetical protein VHH36_02615, partial [Candidatus Thermoplasmatota archaeon]|nr:hypothetical protein [Candidatus Thermoplasmatota archaeon]